LKRVIVLDANVIVSGLFGGNPRKALLRALKEDVCISPEIEAEFAALKERLRKKLSFKDLRYWTETFFPSLLRKMRRVKAPYRLQICRDPKDDAYLSLAKTVEADYLVTGDKDLLSLSAEVLREAGLSHLVITTPRKFLDRL
jgi:putative PIN family toxin of toxin-antitoxin system